MLVTMKPNVRHPEPAELVAAGVGVAMIVADADAADEPGPVDGVADAERTITEAPLFLETGLPLSRVYALGTCLATSHQNPPRPGPLVPECPDSPRGRSVAASVLSGVPVEDLKDLSCARKEATGIVATSSAVVLAVAAPLLCVSVVIPLLRVRAS